jgi:hypothetical protein
MDKQNRILLYQLNKQIFKLNVIQNMTVQQKKELKEAYKTRFINSYKIDSKIIYKKESAPQSTIPTTLPVLIYVRL